MGACDPLFEVFVRLGLFLVHESKEVTSTLVGLVPRRFRWIPYSSVSGKWKKACGIKKRSHQSVGGQACKCAHKSCLCLTLRFQKMQLTKDRNIEPKASDASCHRHPSSGQS